MDDEVLDLTQDDNDGDSVTNTDARFDKMFPAVKRLDSGISSASSISSKTIGSSRSSKTIGSSRSRRKSVGKGKCIDSKSASHSGSVEVESSNKKKKRQAAGERLTKKQRLEEEKAAKQESNEASKPYKPGECMKYMNVELHPSLKSVWYMADVARELDATGASLVGEPSLCDDKLVVWTRTRVRKLATNDDGVVELTPRKEACKRALYVMTAEEAAPLVAERELASHMTQVSFMANCKVTLAVFGVKDYFKKSTRKTQNSSRKLMNEIEMEMAFTDLLVTADCDTVVANTPNELALHILWFTKAIAEEPFKNAKRACDEEADFYMRGDNKKCVPVDKTGLGLGRLWQQMIAVLPLSSLETSRAVCAEYKSPLQLYQALQTPNGLKELAELGVARSAVPGSVARRLGPEFARKLKILFTSENGHEVID